MYKLNVLTASLGVRESKNEKKETYNTDYYPFFICDRRKQERSLRLDILFYLFTCTWFVHLFSQFWINIQPIGKSISSKSCVKYLNFFCYWFALHMFVKFCSLKVLKMFRKSIWRMASFMHKDMVQRSFQSSQNMLIVDRRLCC